MGEDNGVLVNEEYDNPLDEVVSSTLLGSHDFITFIKDKYLSIQKPDKNMPALKELTKIPSLQDIVGYVDSVFSKEASLGRNIKIYLCQKYKDHLHNVKLTGTLKTFQKQVNARKSQNK